MSDLSPDVDVAAIVRDAVVAIRRTAYREYVETNEAGRNPYEREWRAWLKTIDGQPRIHIWGRVTMPAGGYYLTLKPHYPPGANPSILLIDLLIDGPLAGPQIPLEVPAAYSEHAAVTYRSITILTPNGDVNVPVEVAP